MTLSPHHLRTVDRLIDRFKDDPNILALLIGGSLVKGYGNERRARSFVAFVTSGKGQAILQKYGFLAP